MSLDNSKEDAAAFCETDAIEERREKRQLRHWLVKAFAVCFIFVLVACTLSLMHVIVIQEKTIDTGFLSALFDQVFKFLNLVLA